MKLALVLTSLVLSSTEGAWWGGGWGRRGGGGGTRGGVDNNSLVVTPLTEDEKETMLLMREEEKVARDVYLTFFDIYGRPIFANIADSEQTHMDRMKSLLDKYDVEDPVDNENDVGTFENSLLQKLYNDLVDDNERGDSKLFEALMNGAYVEEVDIQDLLYAIDESSKRDVDLVYLNLLSTSYNHLRAFVKNIAAVGGGGKYIAQVLTQDKVDDILNL